MSSPSPSPARATGTRPSTIAYPRRQRRAIGAAVLWTLAFPIVFTAIGKLVGQLMHLPKGPPSWLGAALLGGIGFGAVAATVAHRLAAARRGTIRREGDALVVERAGATRTIPMSDVDTGWTSKSHAAPGDQVGVTLRGGETIIAEVPAGEGNAKLEELGLDASKRRLHLTLWSGLESVLMGFAGSILGLLAWLPLGGLGGDVLTRLGATDLNAPLVFATLVPMMVLGALAMRRVKPEVTIGSDGVIVAGGSIRANKRYYPLDKVAGVEIVRAANARNQTQTVVKLRMIDGSDADIATFLSTARTEALADTLANRVREAMAARDAAPVAEASSLLDDVGGGVGAWLGSLRELAAQGDGYRSTALTRDRLVALVDDGRAALRRRIGAAVMLAEKGDAEGLARVRIAADASASPRVRIALEKVAERAIDEASIEEALAEAEAGSAERAVQMSAQKPA